MKDVCIVLFILISEICVGFEYAKVYDTQKMIHERQLKIESKIDSSSNDIEAIKREIAIFDQVVDKVIQKEW